MYVLAALKGTCKHAISRLGEFGCWWASCVSESLILYGMECENWITQVDMSRPCWGAIRRLPCLVLMKLSLSLNAPEGDCGPQESVFQEGVLASDESFKKAYKEASESAAPRKPRTLVSDSLASDTAAGLVVSV